MTRHAAAFACIGVALLALACKSPYDHGSEKGSVIITFSAGNAKTLVPNFAAAINRYDVSAGNGTTTQTKSTASGGSIAFDNLPTGSWTFNVSAIDAAGTTIGSGSRTLSITTGSNQVISIPIAFSGLAGSGKGRLSIKVIWPDGLGIDSVDAVMPDVPSLISTGPVSDGSNYQETFVGADISAGAHTLKLVFFRGGQGGVRAGIFVESVNICSGLTTDSWIDGSGAVKNSWTLSASDFLDASADLSGISIAGASFSFYPNTLTYTVTAIDADKLSFTAFSTVEGQTITFSLNGAGSMQIAANAPSLAYDFSATNPNVLSIYTWAPDRNTAKTYTINMPMYSLIFDANGTSGTYAITRSQGRTISLPGSGGITLAGYGFGGWNSAPDGTGTHYDVGASYAVPGADSTLYAQWGNASLASQLSAIHNGGSVTLSGSFSSADYSLLKDALQNSTGTVELDLSGLSVLSLPAREFNGCSSLASIILPPTLQSIPDNCFYNCSGLTALAIPDSVTDLGSSIVSGCVNLQTITLGTGAHSFPGGFTDSTLAGPLPALSAINVAPGNTSLMSDNGVLYRYDHAILFKYPPALPLPPGNIYVIPEGVMTIIGYAFENCSPYLQLSVPTTVNNIFTYAFTGFQNIITFNRTSFVVFNAYAPLFEYTTGGYSSGLTINVPVSALAGYQGLFGAGYPYTTF
jgi:hypothetical protein